MRKEFGSFVAVHDAHFSVERGEFFSILGPSGCGKTTTLEMIAGFERPTAGRVLLGGVDVSAVPPWKRDVNTVFQQYALFPHMSVADNIAFGPRSKKLPRAEVERRVSETLEVVRLGELGSRRPSQLSGGQQQRVALARALVNLPSALLLDEPLAALDLKLRQAMQLELKRIQREVGITFVFVTHDQSEALTMSDRVAVMSQGRVEQIGTPEDIYLRPASLFVAGFIGSANLLAGTTDGRDGDATIVRLECGSSIRTRAQPGLPTSGEPCSVMLRPESLRPALEPPAPGRGLEGRVIELVFQGASSRLRVALSDGTELIAQVETDSRQPAIHPGDTVWLTWEPESLFLVAGWKEPPGNDHRENTHDPSH